MKKCNMCDKKLPWLSFFTGENTCSDCKAALALELSQITNEIINSQTVLDPQLEKLKKHPKNSIIQIYSDIYNAYESDDELSEEEINVLKSFQEYFGLTNAEVDYDARIRPYLYVRSIKKENKLPEIELSVEGGGQFILKNKEVVHYASNAVLKEIKTVNLGYSGGSHGVSFRIAKGVRYRIGAHRGQIIKEDRLVQTSSGALVITNQRLFLLPARGNKPLSIPLNKILSYSCFDNGLEVYKENREKGYFFEVDNSGSVEVFGICLSYLLKKE